MLRDPVERSVAEWRFSGTGTFEKHIKTERIIIDQGLAIRPNGTDWEIAGGLMPTWKRIRRGFYTPQLESLEEIFGTLDNVLVIQSERYFSRPKEVLAQVDEFLGVDPKQRKHDIQLKPSQHRHRAGDMPPPLQETLDYLRGVYRPSLKRFYKFMQARPSLTGGVPFQPYPWSLQD